MIGQQIGPYAVLSKLGAGGMGEVYRARDTRLERDVALKVLPTATLADPTARARLLREARLASQLNHPNVCTIYEVGEAEGQAFIAMELVEGRPLSDLITTGSLPATKVLDFGRQLADALAHAHDRGVVHRDLKSNNVIVTPEGRVKVLDFGLAKRLASEDAGDTATLTRQAPLTEVGRVVGTLAYMAPEQLRGASADARSDVWALGVVLHEMATGARPFRGTTSYELSSAILNQAPPSLPASMPPALAAVAARCLAKEPGERYQRGGEVRAALEAAASGEKLPLWPALRAFVARHRVPAALAVLVAVLASLAALDVGGVRSRLLGRAGGARPIRMAVLPLENRSHDPAKEDLSDGLTQELTGELGRLHPGGLQVVAWTSMKRYKNTTTPVRQLAADLNGLDYVLAGSAQPDGSRMRVALELIAVDDERQVWQNRYDSPSSDLPVMESDVARNVAHELALDLLPAEQKRLADARPVNGEAYELYLKASQYWVKCTREGLDTAEGFLKLALEKDPNFAKAWTGLTWVWAIRTQAGLVPQSEGGVHSGECLSKALALDDTLAEAHYLLANVKFLAEYDPRSAGLEFKRAVELDPNDADGVLLYSGYLATMGRAEEAVTVADRAASLDPFNVFVLGGRAFTLVIAGRYEEALEGARKTLAMDPSNGQGIGSLMLATVATRSDGQALTTVKDYLRQAYKLSDLEASIDRGVVEDGFRGAMKRGAEALAVHGAAGEVLPTDVALLYVLAGDYAHAVEWFEKSYNAHDGNTPYIVRMPFVFDPLRADPRFQALLRRMGLPLTPAARSK